MRAVIVFSLLSVAGLLAAGASQAEDLIAFVGEKISVTQFEPKPEPNTLIADGAFKAKYRVLEVIYGEHAGKTIEFDAYDHYGRPAFEKHRYALLFVSSDGNTFYHQKYQFFPVFKTKSGVWAGCGDPYRFEADDDRGSTTARPMDFGADAYFDLEKFGLRARRQYFPSEYFAVRGSKAYCQKGNTVQELFEIKRQGVLKSRGLVVGPAKPAKGSTVGVPRP